jgi:hypothetical protein
LGYKAVVLTILAGYLGREAGRRNRVHGHLLGMASGTPTMTTFDKREEEFERKFALDEELKFKTEARRNKLFGLWVADKLGMPPEEAKTYAREIVAADFEQAGGVIHKALTDLTDNSIAISDLELRAKMNELLALAIVQVKSGI